MSHSVDGFTEDLSIFCAVGELDTPDRCRGWRRWPSSAGYFACLAGYVYVFPPAVTHYGMNGLSIRCVICSACRHARLARRISLQAPDWLPLHKPIIEQCTARQTCHHGHCLQHDPDQVYDKHSESLYSASRTVQFDDTDRGILSACFTGTI